YKFLKKGFVMNKIKLSLALILFTILSFFLVIGSPYEIVWKNTELFESGDYDPTRGVVWNPHTDHLLVVTRSDPYPRIEVLDPETGETLGQLDTTGLTTIRSEEGLSQIDIDDDGHIYVCNLGDDISGWNFKVWRYEDEESTPSLIFDQMLDSGDDSNSREWYGASFEVIGSGDSTYLYTSGWENNQIAVLKLNSSNMFELDHFIPIPTKNSARHGIAALEPGGNLWISGAGTTDPPVRLISNQGDVLAEVPSDTMIGGAASEAIQWNLGHYNLISAINANADAHTITTIQYQEDQLGTINFDYFGDISDSLATGNINATAVLRYDSTRNWMYCLDGNNFLAALDLNNLAKVTTPRDSGLFAIQLNGKKKEYTHYDRLNKYENRTLYTTWSDDIIYTAISGNTLYAPYQARGLYVAFNTDPDGSNGTTSPPDAASSVQELPFNADVVVKFDSDDFADLANDPVADKWTTGIVYQWNGSEWTESTIEGLDINYGAMGIIGDGNDSLITEIGFARTPQGIGADISNIQLKVYLAENAADGEVLASFPNNNETGNGVSFSSYYHFNDLGHGIYPAYEVEKVGTCTGIDQTPKNVSKYKLQQNYPNPFNPVTNIRYTLPHSGKVNLSIYNLSGQLVKTLVNEKQNSGKYQIKFNGSQISSGIYFYKLSLNSRILGIKKMALIK
ncbi:MAG TPA: T9SS type A sorting domain-containing protein, partial [bacterium]|nr:T9SS type A sorting domain-containing protein [bacterium]